jgi:hypothetical protein
MRLVQLRDREGRRAVAATSPALGDVYRRLDDVETVYELALESIESGRSLAATASTYVGVGEVDLAAAEAEGRLLPPIDHPVPTRCWVTAGDARGDWFFRGNGSTLVGAARPLVCPPSAHTPGPQLCACFVIAEDGTPCRVGFALGHALTDLGLRAAGHAHLRPSAVGPELLLGALPETLEATARLLHGEAVRGSWPVALLPADLATLTEAHFRYDMHRRPGDVHVHFLGQSAGADPVAAQPGDLCELSAPAFGHPLRSPLVAGAAVAPPLRVL